MDGGHGYGVRIRRPREATDDWAADLSLMIAPIIGEDPDALEGSLKRGELVVAHGLPLDEAKQLISVLQGFGADAEVVDSPDAAQAAGQVDMAGLRRALEAASRPVPPAPLGGGPPPVMAPPPRVSGELGDDARANQTRPFDPSMVRAAVARARVGEDPLANLPGLVGSDPDDDDVPTAVAGPDGRRRKKPAGGPPGLGFGASLMGVVDDEGGAGPGATQSFGAGIFEPPPPPPPGPDNAFDGPPPAGSYDGPPPPDRAALAGFTSPGEQFDPAAVRRLRDEPGRRGFGLPDVGERIGPGAFADFGADFDPSTRRRGAPIGDKPTDRLLMPPGAEPGRVHDRPGPRGEIFDGLPPLPEMGHAGPGSPMVVQLEAPVVDPSETGTFTREASLDPLPSDDEETRQIRALGDDDLEPERPVTAQRGAKSLRGVRPGVYRLGDQRSMTGDLPRVDGAPGAILSTGQMVARPVARPDEEVTDSGSFRIVQRQEGGKSRRPPKDDHSPAKAALLSLLPGLGQVYNGQRDRGIAFALAAVLVIPWIWSIVDAAKVAGEIKRGDRAAPDPRVWQRARWGQVLLDVALIFAVAVVLLIWQGIRTPDAAPAPAPERPPASAPSGG